MKNHVLRPLWVAIAFVAIILVARYVMVPKDFGVQGDSFTFTYHRASNVEAWKDSKEGLPGVSYLGIEVCADCHDEKSEQLVSSPHATIQCENCHGPGKDHPETENPETMVIDRNRNLCLRCHADLGYANSSRASLPSISDPDGHIEGNDGDKDAVCVDCHDSHNPNLEDM